MSDDVRFTPKSGHCNAQLGDAAIRRASSLVSTLPPISAPARPANHNEGQRRQNAERVEAGLTPF